MGAFLSESIGENKEFGVNGIKDVTIYFCHTDSTKTSANDTDTEKFFDRRGSLRVFTLRPDQTIQIVSIDDVTFTDPTTVIINTAYTENLGSPIAFKMVIRTTVATTTNIKLRWRG